MAGKVLSDNEKGTVEKLTELLSRHSAKRQVQIARAALKHAEDAVRAESRAAYRKKREWELENMAQIQIRAKLSLSPGDIIRVRGTRDGHGWRKVQKIDGTTIHCLQLVGRRWNFPPTLEDYRETSWPTRNDVSKVSHVLENGQWTDFRKAWNLTPKQVDSDSES